MERTHHVTIKALGRDYSGAWCIVGKDVEVSSAYGSDRAPLGRAKPENVAARLLTKIVEARGR